jgi:hypothetical protein
MEFTRSASSQVSAQGQRISARRAASGSEGQNSLGAAWISRWNQNHWELSPDGSRIALAVGGETCCIRILSLADGSTRNVIVVDWTGFQSMNWSGTGNGLYVSNQSSMRTTLHIGLEDKASVLRQQVGNFETWVIPNDRHPAFLESTSASNAWMIENFLRVKVRTGPA